MTDFHTRRTNKTEYVRTFSEKEVEEALSELLAAKAGIDMTTVSNTSLLRQDKNRSSRGPYREYEVTLTVDHEGGKDGGSTQ